MPTEVIHQIGVGQTYTLYSAWEAAQQHDLVAADEIAVAQLHGTLQDVSPIIFSGWNTSPTQCIKLIAADGQKVESVTRTGAKIPAIPSLIAVNNNDFVIDNILVDAMSVNAVLYGIDKTIFNSCVLLDFITTNPSTYRNSLLVFYTDGFGLIKSTSNVIENCTLIASDNSGLIVWQGSVKNSIVYNDIALQQYPSLFGLNESISNATNDGSESSLTITKDDFVDFDGGDYHLSSSSTLIGAGTDFSAKYTIDFDGEDRGASFDIGFDQYVVLNSSVSVSISASIEVSNAKQLANTSIIAASIVTAFDNSLAKTLHVNNVVQASISVTNENNLAAVLLSNSKVISFISPSIELSQLYPFVNASSIVLMLSASSDNNQALILSNTSVVIDYFPSQGVTVSQINQSARAGLTILGAKTNQKN